MLCALYWKTPYVSIRKSILKFQFLLPRTQYPQQQLKLDPSYLVLAFRGWLGYKVRKPLGNMSRENKRPTSISSLGRQGGWKPQRPRPPHKWSQNHSQFAAIISLARCYYLFLLTVEQNTACISPWKAGLWSKHLTLPRFLKLTFWFLFLFYSHPILNWLLKSVSLIPNVSQISPFY